MNPLRPLRSASLIQVMVWVVLSLLSAGYLRVLVVCAGSCCGAQVQLAFAEKSCCESAEDGGCCPAPATRATNHDAPLSCCSEGGCGDEDDGSDREPLELEPAGPCCASAPVDLETGPLPPPTTWSRSAELVACAPIAALRPRNAPNASVRVLCARSDHGNDPPPLQHLREIVSTTLLRI
ncbi:MAG: hypothetical protein JNM84_17600 [Planctomycetes bacterium]|nr:hypothetical protein [Planctomycetota bacterium]